MATDYPINPPLLGVDVTAEFGETTAPYKFGTKIETIDADGDYRIWRFVKATAAKTIGLLYIIDENWEVQGGATEALTDALPNAVGVPAQTSSDDDANNTYNCFWIQTGGKFDRVETAAAVADNALAYISTTAGKLDDGDDTGVIVQALKFTALTSGATNTTAWSPIELHIAAPKAA